MLTKKKFFYSDKTPRINTDNLTEEKEEIIEDLAKNKKNLLVNLHLSNRKTHTKI